MAVVVVMIVAIYLFSCSELECDVRQAIAESQADNDRITCVQCFLGSKMPANHVLYITAGHSVACVAAGMTVVIMMQNSS